MASQTRGWSACSAMRSGMLVSHHVDLPALCGAQACHLLAAAHNTRCRRPLCEGDMLNIDVTVFLDGYHGDTSRNFFVGAPRPNARRLVDATTEALQAGIKVHSVPCTPLPRAMCAHLSGQCVSGILVAGSRSGCCCDRMRSLPHHQPPHRCAALVWPSAPLALPALTWPSDTSWRLWLTLLDTALALCSMLRHKSCTRPTGSQTGCRCAQGCRRSTVAAHADVPFTHAQYASC